MRRILFSIGVIVALGAVATLVAQSVPSQQDEARQASPGGQKKGKTRSKADRAQDEAQIRGNIALFVKAYNAGNAKAIAALFTPDGLIVDEDGNESQGREAIAATFAAVFKGTPGKRIEVNVESIQFIGPDLALEVGNTRTSAPSEPVDRDRYTVLHVKRNGKWRMALARDEDGPILSAHESLEPLAWLIGDWIDDGGSTVVRSSCRWSKDGNFLLQEFKLQINGENAMNVSQRIGWDPVNKRIRSWVFDSEGGYGESVWTGDGNGWLIRASGVRPDGTTASATNYLLPSGKDGYWWRSADRVVAGERQPAVEVKVVRKPPQPRK